MGMDTKTVEMMPISAYARAQKGKASGSLQERHYCRLSHTLACSGVWTELLMYQMSASAISSICHIQHADIVHGRLMKVEHAFPCILSEMQKYGIGVLW